MITFTFMSLMTSVKDYVEITHKLIEIEPLKNYTEFGSVFTYLLFSLGDFLKLFFSLSLFKNIWSIPIIIPDISSAMISEVSVLDSYFHNAFTFLETNVNTGTNPALVIFEKFIIGVINSLFLILPTSTSHLITLRRFVMQGLDAGYIAGLGTLAGNFLWLSSIILGCRFFIIPWLSLDIFRYLLGFILLVKYIWDSSKERRMALEDLSKWKIFLLNFLLTLTEQSCIYPFISNLSIGSDTSILEGFPTENYLQFFTVHGAYLFGILLGSFSLLQFTCWFWENPAFSIYLWITTKSSFKISTSSYYKILNFTFLYATMLCAIASIPYYGLDYTITNPIGLVPQDRILDQKKSQSDPDKLITETAFLGVNSTDKNSRIRDGVHARRERWKQRLIKYQAYDASLYDQGLYDFLTVEDLNYGFDRFWLRRKMRNHQIRFRLFPGPWMRSLKKQLNNPANQTLENTNKAASGPRVEFFRILFEQFYHPNFHDRNKIKSTTKNDATLNTRSSEGISKETPISIGQVNFNSKQLNTNINLVKHIPDGLENTLLKKLETKLNLKQGVIYSNSALRKFVRNVNTRMNVKLLNHKKNNITNKYQSKLIYSKRWKFIFSKIQPLTKTKNRHSYQLFRKVAKQLLLTPEAKSLKLTTINQKLSTKERKLLNLQTHYMPLINKRNYSQEISTPQASRVNNSLSSFILLRPLNVYLQKEQAFKRKLRYYGSTPIRKLTVGNQAPFLKTLMKRGFYYYKPSLRWKKTLYIASMRRGFRKKSRKPRLFVMPTLQKSEVNSQMNKVAKQQLIKGEDPPMEYLAEMLDQNNYSIVTLGTENNGAFNKQTIVTSNNNSTEIIQPTHSYNVLGKRASRYRHQIYKDVLQHWYYTPFNRLLLKFDIDAFINRQPKSHFLTKNEERILHIRRFLLAEHYDTLRWYTYMQHYKTMKTNIGGTKSFANRTYNQQFQGTFKKIRHLFAITPKQGDLYTLKFDQPLYNDTNLKDNVYYHEELLADTNSLNMNNLKMNNVKSNITNNSLVIMPEKAVQQTQLSDKALSPKGDASKDLQIKAASPTNINILNSQISEGNKNLMSSTSTLLTSNVMSQNLEVQKQVTNFPNYNTANLDFINQSSFLIGNQFLNFSTLENKKHNKSTILQTKLSQENYDFIYSELFVKLIKECKKRLYDQAFLKNYITHRIEKREQLNQEQTKELNKRLEKLKTWLNSEQKTKLKQKTTIKQPIKTTTVLTTGLQKAVNDSLSSSYTNSSINNYLSKSTYSELNYAYTIRTEDAILNKLDVINKLTKDKITEGENKKQENRLTNQICLNLENTKHLLQNLIFKFKPILFSQTKLLKIRTDKNLEWWRKKQRVITKRKNARKRDRFKKQIATVNKKLAALSKKVETEKSNLYKTLYGHYEISDYLLTRLAPKFTDSTLLRKKQDYSFDKQKMPFSIESLGYASNLSDNKKLWQSFFSTKLRKKASSKGRRYRLLSLARYLTATRKPRLVGFDDLIKIDNISTKNGSFLTKEEKEERLNLLLKNKYNMMDSLKKSQIKKRSRHSWKKRARHLFSRNHYKYRKRHIHGNGKLRVMNKKLKKIKSTNELRQWWWASFLPRYLNNLETISYDKSLVTKNLNSNVHGHASLQSLNNFAFKPLSNNEAIITSPNIQTSSDILQTSHNPLWGLGHKQPYIINNRSSNSEIEHQDLARDTQSSTNKNTQHPQKGWPIKIERSYSDRSSHLNNNINFESINLTTTSLPFYAGWDESLRKFVVTNRLLSRRDAGLTVKETISTTQTQKSQEIVFTNTPIEGLNEGSFLYWQTDMPFNSYNIDQFITTNQSFYAPLGWRRFELRHSILKTWINYSNYLQTSDQYLSLMNNQRYSLENRVSSQQKINFRLSIDPASPWRSRIDPPMEYLAEMLDQAKINKNKPLIISMKNLSASINSVDPPMEYLAGMLDQKQEKIAMKKGIARRIKKRYKLLKQTPNQLMYSPTGPLLTDVLPSHYISVFDQQYRFSRNRYLKRNTLKTLKKTTLLALIDSSNQTVGINKEFTLRKRVKPRRKYHRKRFIKKDGLIFPRRTKFSITSSEDKIYFGINFRGSNGSEINNFELLNQTDLRWRPSSKTKQKRKESLRSKIKSNKRVKTNPLRLRQLRRREFQQILKPIQRYIPRNGGFTWPGDYLRLEVVEMPKLKAINIKKTSLKQKINVQPVGIMPRRYLIEKQNINVLKKKLEKAYSSHQLSRTVNDYKNLIQN